MRHTEWRGVGRLQLCRRVADTPSRSRPQRHRPLSPCRADAYARRGCQTEAVHLTAIHAFVKVPVSTARGIRTHARLPRVKTGSGARGRGPAEGHPPPARVDTSVDHASE